MATGLATKSPCVTAKPGAVRALVDGALKYKEPVMLDIETTGLDPRTGRLVMVQLRQASWRSAAVIDCRPDPTIVSMLAPLAKLVIVGHNLKFDLGWLIHHGLRFPKVFDTMLAEQVILGVGMESAREQGIDLTLRGTLKRRCGIEVSKLERTWFFDLDQRPDDWAAPFPAEEIAYGAADVDNLLPLFEAQRIELDSRKLREVAAIEMRALPALAEMEWRGIRVDVDGWRTFIQHKEREAKEHENTALAVLGPHILNARIAEYDRQFELYRRSRGELALYESMLRQEYEGADEFGVRPCDSEAWGVFKQRMLTAWRAKHTVLARPKLRLDPPNIGSTDQLIVALEALGVPVPEKRNPKGIKTKTTESEALEKLAPDWPILRSLLDYRQASKFVDAFGEKLLAYVGTDGRIHPDYRQIGADTGRMSCTKPNWQQIPSKGDGDKLRACVIPAEGHKLLTADFSNIELRILADLSGDRQMLAMFASGEDLHSYVARLMFKLKPNQDPKKVMWRGGLTMRAAAKVVNYLIPYGGSAFKLALDQGIPVEDAEDLLDQWFKLFPQVNSYLRGVAKEVHTTLRSRTMAGRLRFYHSPGPEPVQPYPKPGQKDFGRAYSDYKEQQRAWLKAWRAIERQARNTPIQGTSADITKLAVALFYETNPYPDARIVAVVHDEIVVECPTRLCERVASIQADAMVLACKTYLKRVVIPRPVIEPSDRWEH